MVPYYLPGLGKNWINWFGSNTRAFSYATVTEGEGVFINGKSVKIPNIEYLELKLGKVKVQMETSVPLGYGYGISASISLAYALGFSELKGIDRKKAVLLAHESEIVSGNGLGDVVAQYFGRNVVYREKPGFPPHGKIRIFELESDNIYSRPIEAMSTRNIVRTLYLSLNLINEFVREPTIHKFFEVSRKFNESLGFISPYPNSFRKKGLILKLGEPDSNLWIRHRIAQQGAYVE